MIKNGIIRDVIQAIKLTADSSSGKLLQSWIYVPAGLMAMLAACFGIDVLFKHVGVSFPASVAGLIVLFLGLLAMEATLGRRSTKTMKKVTALIDVSAGWSLRWMGIFFTPSFILLPLSPPIGVVEVFKITGVFVVGFFIMMVMAAYLTRSLQLVLGTSKRSTEEVNHSDDDDDDVPATTNSTETSRATSISAAASSTVPLQPLSLPSSRPQSPPQLRLQNHIYSSSSDPATAAAVQALNLPFQTPIPLPRAERWAAQLSANLDVATFASVLVLVGIPLYYTPSIGYAMPLHVAINVLTYFAALRLPLAWRQYLHPVLVCSLLSVLTIWAFAEIKGDGLTTALHEYRTGAKYLELWERSLGVSSGSDKLESKNPGAGDVFGTVLDASIVSLALPMFQYRRELRTHFLSILVPSVLISVGSLFSYPPLCYAVGITAERSLAFASRSLTLALAIPATENLGGDANTIAAVAIVSGILGAVVGQRMLALMRIPQDDYVTRGVTLGVNSSAIATAVLLRTDPRAAALSSLSMTLFGTVTVLFTSIPPMASIIRSLVGL